MSLSLALTTCARHPLGLLIVAFCQSGIRRFWLKMPPSLVFFGRPMALPFVTQANSGPDETIGLSPHSLAFPHSLVYTLHERIHTHIEKSEDCMEEVRVQVHTCLTTLLAQSKISTVDVPFALEQAQVDPILPAQVVVATRLLRRYTRALEAYGLAVLDEQAMLNWALVQDDALSGEDLSAETLLA